MSETFPCPLCDAHIGASAKKCRHCGEWVSRNCLSCGTPIRREWAAEGRCAQCKNQLVPVGSQVPGLQQLRKREVAGLLGILLGGIGGHKFYLGKPIQGLVYLIFCWTMIPAVVGLVEGITYIASSDEAFQAKYG